MAPTKTQQKTIKSVIARLRCDPVRWQDDSLHAGESDEVRAALTDPEVKRYLEIWVTGALERLLPSESRSPEPPTTIATKTPAQLRAALEAAYPPDATCWSQATDEVRDMSRGAREMLGIPDCEATDFYELETPSAWNTVGVNSTIDYYVLMAAEQRATYPQSIAHLY